MAQGSHQGFRPTGADELMDTTEPRAPARLDLMHRLDALTRITVRPIASPLPMGFIGLAMATVTVASLNLGWVPAREARDVAVILLVFVVPLQATTSILGHLARDGVAGTGMAVLSGTWATFGLVMLLSPPGGTSRALGIVLALSAIAMLLVAIGAAFGTVVPALVLAGASARFATSALYQLSGNATWETVTGVVGIVLGALALYAAFASLLEGVGGRTVLPMGRRGRARAAVEGGLAEQLVDVAHEPGVRVRL
jgi:uncharacterized protein